MANSAPNALMYARFLTFLSAKEFAAALASSLS